MIVMVTSFGVGSRTLNICGSFIFRVRLNISILPVSVFCFSLILLIFFIYLICRDFFFNSCITASFAVGFYYFKQPMLPCRYPWESCDIVLILWPITAAVANISLFIAVIYKEFSCIISVNAVFAAAIACLVMLKIYFLL